MILGHPMTEGPRDIGMPLGAVVHLLVGRGDLRHRPERHRSPRRRSGPASSWAPGRPLVTARPLGHNLRGERDIPTPRAHLDGRCEKRHRSLVPPTYGAVGYGIVGIVNAADQHSEEQLMTAPT